MITRPCRVESSRDEWILIGANNSIVCRSGSKDYLDEICEALNAMKPGMVTTEEVIDALRRQMNITGIQDIMGRELVARYEQAKGGE